MTIVSIEVGTSGPELRRVRESGKSSRVVLARILQFPEWLAELQESLSSLARGELECRRGFQRCLPWNTEHIAKDGFQRRQWSVALRDNVSLTRTAGGENGMLHFSCDLCGCSLDHQRYVVQLEAFPAFDPDELQAADVDVDHLQAVAEALEQDSTVDELDDGSTQQFRYDLCSSCYRKYLRDPLGRESGRRLKFSQN